MARVLVEQFIAGYSCAPATITLDLDHTDDATYGQQALSFYKAHYGHHCYLPLLVFEANSGALVTAVLRPGKRPTGAEDRVLLHLPSACPVKALLAQVCRRLYPTNSRVRSMLASP